MAFSFLKSELFKRLTEIIDILSFFNADVPFKSHGQVYLRANLLRQKQSHGYKLDVSQRPSHLQLKRDFAKPLLSSLTKNTPGKPALNVMVAAPPLPIKMVRDGMIPSVRCRRSVSVPFNPDVPGYPFHWFH